MNTQPVPSAVPTPAEVEGLLSQAMAGEPGTTFTYRGKTWERGRSPSGLRFARLGNLVLCQQNRWKSSRWAELARQGQSVWWIWQVDRSGARTTWLVRIVDNVWTDLDEAA